VKNKSTTGYVGINALARSLGECANTIRCGKLRALEGMVIRVEGTHLSGKCSYDGKPCRYDVKEYDFRECEQQKFEAYKRGEYNKQ